MDVILLNEIQDMVGTTGATGGSTTAGTVMAKLNAIIGNTAVNNTESATGNLSQKSTAIFNYVKSILGATGDGGGTTSAGSISAKCNAILNKANSGVTVTEKYYSASNSSLNTPGYYTSNLACQKSLYPCYKISDNWIPKADGVVRCSMGVSVKGTSTVASKYQNVTAAVYFVSMGPVSSSSSHYAGYASKSKGTVLNSSSSSQGTISSTGYMYSYKQGVASVGFSATAVGESQTSTGTYTADIVVCKGYPVFAVVEPHSTSVSNSYGTAEVKVTSFSITGTLNNL